MESIHLQNIYCINKTFFDMRKLLLIIVLLISNEIHAQDINKLQDFVNDWIGVPYKLGGKTKSGIDCSKFVQRLYKDVYELAVPGTARALWEASIRIAKSDLSIGDIVFFNSPQSPSGWHCGLYLGEGIFVHAPRRGETVKLSSLNENIYLKRYKGAGRIIQ